MNSLRPRNLTDYLRAARRHKVAIIAPALVIMIASAIAIKQLPNIYASSTFIIVETPTSDSQSEGSQLELSRRLTTIRQQVTSRTRLEGIINKFGLYQKDLEKGARIDDVIAQMRDEITVDVTTGREQETDAFTISFRSTDPETARQVTAELADRLIADNVQAMQSQISGEADVLRQRASELSSQLNAFEQKAPWVLSLKEDTPIAVPLPTGRSYNNSAEILRTQQMSIETLKDQQYKIQQQLTDLEGRIAAQRQIVEQQKKSTVVRDNPTYALLITKRAELQGQRDNLINRQELTDKHPRVIAILDQINAINNQIEELRKQDVGAASQTPEARELLALQAERNKLKIDLEVTGREITRRIANPPVLPSSSDPVAPINPAQRDANSARLAQDYLGLKQNYKEVIAKLQDMELKRQTLDNAKVDRFRVLDQANLPQRPHWPNRRLMGVMAAGLGLVVGLCFAFAFEFRRLMSLLDARDVEHYTRLPLLASIPKTISPAEQKRLERQARMRLIVGTAIAFTATIALTKALTVVNIFSMIGKK